MGNVCTQGPADVENPNQPSFQSILLEQKAKEETPEKLAEKANTTARFGLSAETEATEATPSDSAFREYQDERRKQDDFLSSVQMEVVPSEVE